MKNVLQSSNNKSKSESKHQTFSAFSKTKSEAMRIYKNPNKKNKLSFNPTVQNLSRVGHSIENYKKRKHYDDPRNY
jgi:hypothetical protein